MLTSFGVYAQNDSLTHQVILSMIIIMISLTSFSMGFWGFGVIGGVFGGVFGYLGYRSFM